MYTPLPAPPPPPPKPHHPMPRWVWMLPLFSCGFLGFVPAIVVATRARSRAAWLWASGFSAATLIAFAMMGTQPDGVQNMWTDVGAVLLLAAAVGSVIFSAVVGARVGWSSASPPPLPTYPTYDPNAAAIAAVQAVRQKRESARTLALNSPQMARDLRIGRPDLQQYYDDGGLVDLNSAPAAVLVSHLRLTDEQAAQVVAVREKIDGYKNLEDLMTYAQLDVAAFDRVRELAVLL